MNYRHEENNYPKAFLATGIILALIIAMCYFMVFKMPVKQEDGTGGILVNYGTVDEGMGSDYMSTEEPSVAEHANNTKPEKVTKATPTEDPTPVDNSSKQVVTQNTEDAPEVSNDKKPSETVKAQQKVTKAEAKPVVNQNALYKGKTNGGTGEGDGTGNTPGNQGKPTGSTLADNYDGTGSGNGGTGISQRSFVSSPVKPDGKRQVGKVVVDYRVDKNGNVIYAKAGGRGTTITDFDLLQKCEDSLKGAKLNSSDTAPDMQQGKVTFIFKLQ
jgi:hypothetical protein